MTPSDYRRYLNLVAEKRLVSLATFDIAALADTIVVRDEDVQAYYDARPNEFRAPESVDFEYVEIRRDIVRLQAPSCRHLAGLELEARIEGVGGEVLPLVSIPVCVRYRHFRQF